MTDPKHLAAAWTRELSQYLELGTGVHEAVERKMEGLIAGAIELSDASAERDHPWSDPLDLERLRELFKTATRAKPMTLAEVREKEGARFSVVLSVPALLDEVERLRIAAGERCEVCEDGAMYCPEYDGDGCEISVEAKTCPVCDGTGLGEVARLRAENGRLRARIENAYADGVVAARSAYAQAWANGSGEEMEEVAFTAPALEGWARELVRLRAENGRLRGIVETMRWKR